MNTVDFNSGHIGQPPGDEGPGCIHSHDGDDDISKHGITALPR